MTTKIPSMRLNEATRRNIHASILATLPKPTYYEQLRDFAQDHFCALMSKELKTIYDDPDLRSRYLRRDYLTFEVGAKTLYRSPIDTSWIPVYGLGAAVKIPADRSVRSADQIRLTMSYRETFAEGDNPFKRSRDEDLTDITKDDDVVRLVKAAFWEGIRKSRLVEGWFNYTKSYDALSNRLDDVLKGASSTRQLREALEPELHRFIPVPPSPDKPATTGLSNLPAVSTHFVNDLRTLGADLK